MKTLREAVERYYYTEDEPQGSPIARGKIRNIVDRKIEWDMNDPKAKCNRLFQVIKSMHSRYKLVNANHHLFPNYVVIIDLASSETELERKHTWLYVVVSLLCDHYTIFLDNQYTYISSNPAGALYVNFNIVSLEQKFVDCDYPYMQPLKDVVEDIFPEKSFLSHYALNNQKIKGLTPFGLEPAEARTYSLFDLLFFNEICNYQHVEFMP